MCYKIGFVGCAGTGKSTLAKAISERLDLTFLRSKDITRPILQSGNYDYGSGLQIERFLASGERQNEILKGTISSYKKNDQFVTDRTVIDLAAYAIKELHESDQKSLKNIISICQSYFCFYTHLVFCPWRDVPIEDNQKRTLDQWYQFIIDSISKNIINQSIVDNDTKVIFLNTDGFDDRLKEILRFLEV